MQLKLPALDYQVASVPEGRHVLALGDPTELEERRRGTQGKADTPTIKALEARHQKYGFRMAKS